MTGSFTRRGFVGLAGAALLGALAGRARSALAAPGEGVRYLTEPGFDPPAVAVTVPAAGTAPGFVFVAPLALGADAIPPGRYGPLILADDGEPVWFLPLSQVAAQNLQVQTYRGEPVLTWYEGPAGGTYGGSWVVYDASYRELHRIHGGNGYGCDLHELVLTSRGTALLSIYNEVRADLSAVGGPADGRVVEGIVQELDLASKRVLLEWHSLDHVPVTESYRTGMTAAGNVDYFHLNSIDVDPRDGDLLVSSRHTSTVYKVDRRTGAIRWRLGGKRSDFALGAGATFNFQHDARAHADGTLTLFDNGASGTGNQDVEPASRPLRLRVDERRMTADLVQVYQAPDPRLATALGDVQQLADGGVFVGWGTAGPFSEFGPDGRLRFDAGFADGSVSYRALRSAWVGAPLARPSAVVAPNGDGTATVHASWNGATEVTHWQVRTGPAAGALRAVHTSPRRGFETAIVVGRLSRYVAVAALDRGGSELGASLVLRA